MSQSRKKIMHKVNHLNSIQSIPRSILTIIQLLCQQKMLLRINMQHHYVKHLLKLALKTFAMAYT